MKTESDILGHIAAYKRLEIAQAKAAHPLQAITATAREALAPRGFRAALEAARTARHPALIAEIKKASPSKGVIREDFHPPDLARAYEQGGATCLSVLTDTPSFQGAMDDLPEARNATSLPVLRKDFMLDTYQVAQSRAMGADCILIIMAMLDDEDAEALFVAAEEWGMDALVEVHDHAELTRALALGATLIGINNRDLKTFATNIETCIRLAPHVPRECHLVAESGLSTSEDLRRLSKAGITSFLIGESLMRAEDVEAATLALLEGAKL